jgi:hypothetical protein
MNLLPDSRKRALARLYLVRVAVVATTLLAAVLFIHTALMVPSLIYARQVVNDRTSMLAGLGEQLAGSEDKQVGERVQRLTVTAQALAQSAQGPSASGAVRAVMDTAHSGVLITGLSYARGQAPDAHRMTIAGKAKTREALRAYAFALDALPYVTSVDLPISAYAKESDITFSLTLVGSLTP